MEEDTQQVITEINVNKGEGSTWCYEDVSERKLTCQGS